MRYIGEITGDDFYHPSIHFEVFIAPTAFSELAANIKSGLFPGTITIGLVDDPSLFFTTSANPKKKAPIEIVWEPDGSGMIWHNKEKENQKIEIESIRFDYAVVKPPNDEKQIDRPLPMQFNAPTERLSEQVAMIQTGLAEIEILAMDHNGHSHSCDYWYSDRQKLSAFLIDCPLRSELRARKFLLLARVLILMT
jgi:hypothetical protein